MRLSDIPPVPLAAHPLDVFGAEAVSPPCGYSPTFEVSEVAGITRHAVAEDRPKEEEHAPLANVTREQGYQHYLNDLQSVDPQQAELISAISSEVVGYERIQGPAAAGSGKTRCVALGVAGFYHRFVATGRVHPSEVVVTTFTKVAATELKSRLSRYIPKYALEGSQCLRIGTYHSRSVSQWHKFPEISKRELSAGIEKEILGVLLGESYCKKAWGAHQVHEDQLLPWGIPDIVPLDVLNLLQKSRGEAGREAADLISNQFEAWGFHSPEAVRTFYHQHKESSFPRIDAVKAAIDRADSMFGPVLKSARCKALDMRRGMMVLTHIWENMCRIKETKGLIGFGDIMDGFLQNASKTRAKLFIVDEAQDNSWEQVQIAELSVQQNPQRNTGGRIVMIGDGRQCIPAGQLVATPQGNVPIEKVRVGQYITVLQGGVPETAEVTGKSTTIKPWAYEYTVQLPDGATRTFQATPEHVLFGAIGPTDGTYLYLMYRRGYGYRIGTSGISGKMTADDTLSIRTNQEGGEALWLLGSYSNHHEAIQEETQLSYRYQVPMAPFKPRDGGAFATVEATQRLFKEFGANGTRILADVLHNPEAHPNPVYHAKASQSGRVAINVLISTRKGQSELAIEAGNELIPEAVKASYSFGPTGKGTTRIRKYGPYAKMRLLAEALHKEIPNSTIVEVLSLTGNDRRVFAVAAGSVVPGVLVPVVIGQNAVLCPVISRKQVPSHTCYDLEVASAGHFVVNGVPVHNSVYSFRGASPDLFINAGFGENARAVPISVNYRSGWGIVELGNRICQDSGGFSYQWAVGGTVQVGRKTPDGLVYLGNVTAEGGRSRCTVREYEDHSGRIRRAYPEIPPMNARLTDGIAAEVLQNAERLKRGWADYAIISRGNADLGMAELSLARNGIPSRYTRNRVGFLFRGPVTRILKLLALGAGLVTDAELAAEHLLDVLKNDQGQYWFNCLTYPQWSDPTKVIYISPTVVREAFQEHWNGNLLDILQVLGGLPQVKPKAKSKSRGTGATWTIFYELADQLRSVLDLSWPAVIGGFANLISAWGKRDVKQRREIQQARKKAKQEEAGEPEEADEDTSDARASGTVDPDDDPRERFHEVLYGMATTFETFADFMDYVQEARTTRKSFNPNAVVLTTGHSAKGLEWPVTYVICESGRWPSLKAATPAEKAEERRVLYVAATRARDELHFRAAEESGLGEDAYDALYTQGLLRDLEDKRGEQEKIRRLREIVCIPEGERWQILKYGVPFPCNGVYYWHSAEQAQMAYLAAHNDTLTGWVGTLVDSLRPTQVWVDLSTNLSDEALQELIMQLCRDELATAALGWSTLYSLISLAGYPVEEIVRSGDVVEFSDSQGIMGYLVPPSSEEAARYYGQLRLFKPFTGVTCRRVPAGYTQSLRNSSHHAHSILDNSPTLLDARQRYVDYLHEHGMIPEISLPVHAPEISEVPTVVEQPGLWEEDTSKEPEVIREVEDVAGVAEPEDGSDAGDAGDAEVVEERYVRHLVNVTAPFSDTQGSSVCVLDMTREDYPVLIRLSLAGSRYLREFALVNVATRVPQKNGPDKHTAMLYQVVRTAEKDSMGRYKGKLVPVHEGGIDTLSAAARRAFGEQQHDDVAACYLSDPRITPRDQALLEGHFLQDMKLDFGRITTERGYTLISSIYVQETEQRLIGEKCPWFKVISRNHAKYLEWDVEYITKTCGPVEPTE